MTAMLKEVQAVDPPVALPESTVYDTRVLLRNLLFRISEEEEVDLPTLDELLSSTNVVE